MSSQASTAEPPPTPSSSLPLAPCGRPMQLLRRCAPQQPLAGGLGATWGMPASLHPLVAGQGLHAAQPAVQLGRGAPLVARPPPLARPARGALARVVSLVSLDKPPLWIGVLAAASLVALVAACGSTARAWAAALQAVRPQTLPQALLWAPLLLLLRQCWRTQPQQPTGPRWHSLLPVKAVRSAPARSRWTQLLTLACPKRCAPARLVRAAGLAALLSLVGCPVAEARPRGRGSPRPPRLPPEPPGPALPTAVAATAADPSPLLVACPDLVSSPALTPNTLATELAPAVPRTAELPRAVPELPHSDHTDSAFAPPAASTAADSTYVRSSGSQCTVSGLTSAPPARNNRRRLLSKAAPTVDDASPFTSHPLPEPPEASMLPHGSPGHRGSLATYSPFRPSCSATATQLARELHDHVPYLNSPHQHLLRKEFVRRVGGQFRVTLPSGLSFTCAGPYRHSSGSSSGARRTPRIPGLSTDLDHASLPPGFEAHWLQFRDLEIRRSIAEVHARLQAPPAPESGAGAAGEGAAGPAGFAEYEDGEDPWDSDGWGASDEYYGDGYDDDAPDGWE